MAQPTIQFDDREQALYDEFQSVQDATQRRFDASLERLPLGDIVLTHEDLMVIVERKRHDDFMKSVFDGRLDEQTHRLEEWREAHGENGWTILLVEGSHPPQNVTRHRHFNQTVRLSGMTVCAPSKSSWNAP